jgi:putative FmdB family regulatory protein
VKTLPLYAYRCTQCGHRFEKIQHFRSKPELVCPKCHGTLERPLTAPGLKFKGSGFYINDYAPKSSAPASETASKSGTEAAPAKDKTPSTSENTASAAAAASAPLSGATPSSTTPGSSS